MDERQKQVQRRIAKEAGNSFTEKEFQADDVIQKDDSRPSKENINHSPNGISGSTWVQMANRNLQYSYQEKEIHGNIANETNRYFTKSVEKKGQQINLNEVEKRTYTTKPYVQKQKSLDDDREESWDEEAEEQARRDRERRRKIYLVQKRKKRQQKKIFICAGVILISILVCGFSIYIVSSAVEEAKKKEQDVVLTSPSPVITAEITKEPEEPVVTPEPFEIVVQEELLTPNEYSRPGLAMETITAVVIHYVGNPGTEGISNRNFFESLKDNHENSVSSHFVIGLRGEIIQCVPLDEVAYANRGRNFDTISIECCHPDEEGQFNEVTYEALVQLAAYLLNTYDLGEDALLRHYEVTGKICPRYYVDHPEAWETLKADIMKEVEEHPNSVLVME